ESNVRHFPIAAPTGLVSGVNAGSQVGRETACAVVARRGGRCLGRYSLPPRIAFLGSDSGSGPGAAVVSGAIQFPAQIFVPFTAPTSRHSLDCFGLTFFPADGALCAKLGPIKAIMK